MDFPIQSSGSSFMSRGVINSASTGAIASEILSRKRRMDFFDLANLLDRDGNLQNEMLVFAFAATMLSTIPVLLGNEFDVNVGLRRRKRENFDDYYQSYTAYESQSPLETYENIMTKTSPVIRKSDTEMNNQIKTEDPSLLDLFRDLYKWSDSKVKNYSLLPAMIQLGLQKYHGKENPADKLVNAIYKKWNSLW